jgi:protein transport protein SEC23
MKGRSDSQATPPFTNLNFSYFIGTAVSVALGLLEGSVTRQGSRIMLFISGPPTAGPGMIVGRSKRDNIRSHNDLLKNQAPLTKPSTEFFKNLSDRAIANSIVVDFFACSLDQVGAFEIKALVSRTGGFIVLADKFSQSVFRESLRRIFERVVEKQTGLTTNQLQMGFNAQIDVIHSREFKIGGAIGPCASLKKTGPSVAETETGIGFVVPLSRICDIFTFSLPRFCFSANNEASVFFTQNISLLF